MKILQITKKFPYPKKDGEAWAVLAMAEGLAMHGAEVDLFSLNTKGHLAPEESIEGLRRLGIYKEVFTCVVDYSTSRPGAFLNLFSKKSYHEQRVLALKNARKKLSQLVATDQYDAILVESIFMKLLLEEVGIHVPIIIREHNLEHRIWQRYAAGQSGVKKWYYALQARRLKKLESRLYQDHSDVICISEVDQGYLDTLIGRASDPSVVPIGMPELYDGQEREAEGRPFVVGYIGSLDWRPNIDGLDWFTEYVWPEVLIEVPDAIMIVAGRNDKKKSVWKGKPQITSCGEIEDSDGFLRQVDVLIVPLWSGSGTRVKILQALSIGVPVLATPLAAEGLLLENDVHISIASTPVHWVAELMRLQDPNVRARLVANGLRYILHHHDIEKLGGKAFDIIQGACARK